MKWAIIFIVLLPLAVASEGELLLERNSPTTIDGKTITFVGSSSGNGVFEVDGETDTARAEKWSYINGVHLYYFGKSDRPSGPVASLNYSIEFVCGDGTCSVNESSSTCCTDCACSGTANCFQNQCFKDLECTDDTSCDDANPCTVDSCTGLPPGCTFTAITSCTDDDLCCAAGCSDLEDSDCFNPECRADSECDDSNSDTEDRCQPPGVCESVAKIESEVLEQLPENQTDIADFEISEEQPSPIKIRWDIALGIILVFFIGYFVAKKMKK